MARLNVNPTRMQLNRLKKRLVVAMRGHKLLKDKRDELMRRFLELVRQNRTLRESVESGIKKALDSFVLARAVMQDEVLNTALLAPKQGVSLEVGSKNIMSVNIPVFETKTRTTDPNDIYSYGYAFTFADLDMAVKALADVLPSMLLLAQVEKSVQLLALEIEKTRRRVNALEYIVIPQLNETIRYIKMKLDENERSNLTRLMKVKDMMIEQFYGQNN